MKDPFKRRITLLMLGCLLLACGVLVRASLVQVAKDSRLDRLARKQFQSKLLIRPRRGIISDRNGEPLAVNVETNSLAANPTKIENKRTIARLLAKATHSSYEKILARLREKREFVWIKRQVSDAEIENFKKWHIVNAGGAMIDGLWLVKESQRAYPHNELAAHVLGTVNVDSMGIEGVELWQNSKLSGKFVTINAIKDALGRPTFIDAVAARDIKDGESIALSLDASLQFEAELNLKAAVEKHNARGGSVLIMNAVTGEILAMANEPSFNPNHKGAPADRRRNRVVTDGYEPGSTMKPVLLASALSHGAKLTDLVHGNQGQLIIQGKKISEAEAHEKFEWISLMKMIQVSSNIGAAKLALKVGADRYYGTLQSFGFGNRTELGFPGEISGIVPARKSWQPLTLANVGFGQGILVTPLQMARAYAAFLNGGYLVQPTLKKAAVENTLPAGAKRIISSQIADSVVRALSSVTDMGGTGTKARLDGYYVAGKTGTAQVVDSATGTYSRSRFIASFIGFATRVEPKLVILAMIDEPRGVYYASETAAPLFKNILQAVTNRFAMPAAPEQMPVAPKLLAGEHGEIQDRIALTAAHPASPSVNQALVNEEPDAQSALRCEGTNPDGKLLWRMPSLLGFTPREAIRLLKGHSFDLEIQGNGVIRNQFPEEGKTIAEGSKIQLKLAEP